jgi:hypothetical protein
LFEFRAVCLRRHCKNGKTARLVLTEIRKNEYFVSDVLFV